MNKQSLSLMFNKTYVYMRINIFVHACVYFVATRLKH